MATQLIEAARRRLGTRRPATGPRHPIVALAIVLPCAALLLALFGGWEHVISQSKEVAALLDR